MAATFVIEKAGEVYVVVLMAPDGKIIARSEPYVTKLGATIGIEAIRKHAPDAPVSDRTGQQS
jgi:uncharacterized protein